jgi:phospholipid/cholesterol/gamma-HCH transport system ATP-binding protein
VRGLSVAYGEVPVLRDIDLAVRPGEIMVIMGGSGSGKSTLLNTLLGLLRPTRGTVRLLGQDITRLSERDLSRLRRRMGVAFQGGALFSSLNVGENILLPLREHTNLDEQTMRIMARMKMEVVDLAGREDLMPAELSGGMVKRAALARAIVMDPELLFCDEPSAGLDPVVAKQIDQLILDLRQAFGMTVVVVTHELDSAFAIADRICVLDRGEIRIVDTVDNVRTTGDRRVQDLLNRRSDSVEVDPDAYLSRLTRDIL